MPENTPSDLPLSGLRVLDLSRVISGPVCGRLLADLGADVIKVEAPEGDVLRSLQPATAGLSHSYAHFNAGKRHLCIDLKQPAGRSLVADLATRSDILIENFRPGVAERLDIGAAALQARNPRLIYCSVSGWGQTGAGSTRPAYAPMIHAEIGMLEWTAALHDAPLRQEVHHHADLYAGLMATNAILAAFAQLSRTGRGQHIDVSMAEVMLYVNEYASFEGFRGAPSIDSHTFELFELADGSVVSLVGNPRYLLPAWAKALGADSLLTDPRFARPEETARNRNAAHKEIQALLANIPDVEALQRIFEPRGLMFAVVRSLADALDSQWARERKVMAEIVPGLRIPRTPWHSSLGNQPTPRPPGPLGADNAEVLQEVLDLAPAAIDALESAGVIRAERPSR